MSSQPILELFTPRRAVILVTVTVIAGIALSWIGPLWLSAAAAVCLAVAGVLFYLSYTRETKHRHAARST